MSCMEGCNSKLLECQNVSLTGCEISWKSQRDVEKTYLGLSSTCSVRFVTTQNGDFNQSFMRWLNFPRDALLVLTVGRISLNVYPRYQSQITYSLKTNRAQFLRVNPKPIRVTNRIFFLKGKQKGIVNCFLTTQSVFPSNHLCDFLIESLMAHSAGRKSVTRFMKSLSV